MWQTKFFLSFLPLICLCFVLRPSGLRLKAKGSKQQVLSSESLVKTASSDDVKESISFCDQDLHSLDFNDTVSLIIKALNVKDCQAALSKIEHEKSLVLHKLEIINLEPIGFFKDLETLNLSGNKIEDLSPLAGLSQLKTLQLSNNHLEDLEPLQGLTRLEFLDLSYNQIESVEDLAALKTLRVLNVSHNELQNVTPLKTLKNLKTLDLHDNPIAKMSFKNKENCPRSKTVPLVLRQFCKKDKIHLYPSLKMNTRELVDADGLIHTQKIFPEDSVQIWALNTETTEFVVRVLRSWIKQAKGRTKLAESRRINKLFTKFLREDVDVDEPSDEDFFLLAIFQGLIHGIGYLESSPSNANLSYLSIAPRHLDLETKGLKYRYIGSSIIQKALDVIDFKIVLTPGSLGANHAYLKMGFLPLDPDDVPEDLGDAVIDFDQFAKMRQRLNDLRRKHP